MKSKKGNAPMNLVELPVAAQQGEDGIDATNINTVPSTSIAGIQIVSRPQRLHPTTINQFVSLVERISKRVNDEQNARSA